MYGYERTAPGGDPRQTYGQDARSGTPYGDQGYGGGYGGGGYGYPPPGGGAAGGYGYPPPPPNTPPPGYQSGPPPGGRQQASAQSAEEQPPSPLGAALRGFATGTGSPEEFQEAFIASKVYCPRADTPGFLAMPNTNQPLIPMFTSLKELRRFAGKESKYFVLTGAEVLDLLPTGYGFVLDVEGEHRAVFDAKAVEEMVEFTMRRLYG